MWNNTVCMSLHSQHGCDIQTSIIFNGFAFQWFSYAEQGRMKGWKAFACQWCSTTSIIEAHFSITSSSVAITKGSSVGYAEPRMNWCYVRSMDCMMHNVTIDAALSCFNIKVHSSNILRYKMRKARKSLRNECFSHMMDMWMHMTSKQHSDEGRPSFGVGNCWKLRTFSAIPFRRKLAKSRLARIWEEKKHQTKKGDSLHWRIYIQTSERVERKPECFTGTRYHAVTLPRSPRSREKHAGTHRLNACMKAAAVKGT